MMAGGKSSRTESRRAGQPKNGLKSRVMEKPKGRRVSRRTEQPEVHSSDWHREQRSLQPAAREHWRAGNMLYPLPAVMVSCARPGEKPNIITVAWAGTICSSPAMVSISVRPTRYSYDILCETGEFVINLTTEQLVRAADYCGVRSGRDVDKFREMGLTPGTAEHVGAPVIEESPVNIECRVQQVLPLGSHHMFIAKVLGVDIDGRYLDEKGKLDLGAAGLTVYSHGDYFALGKKLGSFGYSVRRK